MSQTLLEPQVTDGSTAGSWMVVIYNNDTTSVHAVIAALIRATGCDLQEATTEVWEAEHFGKASVHFGDQPTCQDIAAIIASIGVKTTVEPEWQA